jgi:hypothetical protein
MNFREWLLAVEAVIEEGNREMALAMLGGDQEKMQALSGLEPKYLPGAAFFVMQGQDPATVAGYFQKLKPLVDRKKVRFQPAGKKGVQIGPPGQEERVSDWLRFTEIIDGFSSFVSDKTDSGQNDAEPVDGEKIFSQNGIDIYKAHSREACIKHGQGYSFCISQPRNTMWQSYRDTQSSTFHFVFDRNRDKSDPLHVVVVDMTEKGPLLTDARNSTGSIAEFGQDANAYLKHLADRGVDTSIFKNIPKSPQEISDAEKLGKRNPDLNWFKELSLEEKSRYIGRGHSLTRGQFNYLWKNKATARDLIRQYVGGGQQLFPEHLHEVMKDRDLGKTHLRARLIADEHYSNLSGLEASYLSPEQREEFKQRLVTKGAEAYGKQHAFFRGAKAGFLDVVESLGPDREITSYIKRASEKELTKELSQIAELGHKDIAEYVFKLIANQKSGFMRNIKTILGGAARGGHQDVMKTLMRYQYRPKDQPTTELDAALSGAAQGGHKDIVKWMLDEGATDIDGALLSAAESGHKDIVEMLWNYESPHEPTLKQRGFPDDERRPARWPTVSSRRSQKDFVVKQAFSKAAVHNHKDVVEFLLQHMEPEWVEELLPRIRRDENRETLDLVRKYLQVRGIAV